MSELTVLFDFKNPYSYLAHEPTCRLLEELGVTAQWQPLLVPGLKTPIQPESGASRGDWPSASRGNWHRWYRGNYRLMDLRRYAAARRLPAHVFTDARLLAPVRGDVTAAGFLWLDRFAPGKTGEYLSRVFSAYWEGDLALDNPRAVGEIVQLLAQDVAFAETELESALTMLDEQQTALLAAGYFTVPGYLLGDQVYYGRQHLPMLRWQLQGRTGPPPV